MIWAFTRPEQCPICKWTPDQEPEESEDLQEPEGPDTLKPHKRTRKKEVIYGTICALTLTVLAIGAIALINFNTLTPEQEAEIMATPLTDKQMNEINSELSYCLREAALLSYGQDPRPLMEPCYETADKQKFDMRRVNWESTQP